jgi:hypothetical protein
MFHDFVPSARSTRVLPDTQKKRPGPGFPSQKSELTIGC